MTRSQEWKNEPKYCSSQQTQLKEQPCRHIHLARWPRVKFNPNQFQISHTHVRLCFLSRRYCWGALFNGSMNKCTDGESNLSLTCGDRRMLGCISNWCPPSFPWWLWWYWIRLRHCHWDHISGRSSKACSVPLQLNNPCLHQVPYEEQYFELDIGRKQVLYLDWAYVGSTNEYMERHVFSNHEVTCPVLILRIHNGRRE